MHEALLTLPGAYRAGLLHAAEIPEECREYFTFCCVRNPYRRFLAYYLWRKLPHPWGCEAEGLSFQQYFERMRDGNLGPVTVRQHLDKARLDQAIQYEGLPDSFRKVRGVAGIDQIELPPVGKRLTRHWTNYYDQHMADQVFELMRPDFEEFGYSQESWRTEKKVSA